MSNPKLLTIFLILLAILSNLFVLRVHASNQVVADSAISQAERALVSVYEVVLKAEEAGADVSDLLNRLNEAGDLLAQANVLYRLGDFDGAIRFADISSQIGEEVKVEAYELRSLAVEETLQRSRGTLFGSIFGVGIVVFASFLGWYIFKQRYYRQILEMKPEVVSDES